MGTPVITTVTLMSSYEYCGSGRLWFAGLDFPVSLPMCSWLLITLQISISSAPKETVGAPNSIKPAVISGFVHHLEGFHLHGSN